MKSTADANRAINQSSTNQVSLFTDPATLPVAGELLQVYETTDNPRRVERTRLTVAIDAADTTTPEASAGTCSKNSRPARYNARSRILARVTDCIIAHRHAMQCQ